MRRGGRKSVELRKMLFARQHQLGRRERVGELAGLLGDLPGVQADEGDGQQDRQPDPHHVDRRQFERGLGVPRQRIVDEHERGGAGDGETAEDQRHPRRQRGGRDQDRSEKQERERVLQPAGKEQQHRKLGDVEGKKPRRPAGFEPLRHREADAQRDIEPGRQRDHREAGPDRQLVVEPEIHHQHGGGLADHREPAQPHQRIETHAAPGPVGLLGGLLGHVPQCTLSANVLNRDGRSPIAGGKRPGLSKLIPSPLAPRSSRRHMCGLAQPPVGYAQSRRARRRR